MFNNQLSVHILSSLYFRTNLIFALLWTLLYLSHAAIFVVETLRFSFLFRDIRPSTCVKCHSHYFLLFPVVMKPGTCPVIETPVPVPHCPLPAPTDLCEQDGDCSGPEKCCRRKYCGAHVCGLPIGTLAR